MDTPNLKTVLPGWEIVRLLGKGSYGAVYEIRRQVFGETESAALKVITIPQSSSEIEDLRSDGYDDRSITQRFESYLKDIIREYSMMSRLKGCSNVVYCDDVKYVQHDDGFGWDIFIKMELLTPLTRALGPTVPEEQVLRIGKDLCKALVVCEEQHVLHRDIKPQNIFVARDGTCKLGDFGVAKAVERTSGGTKTGTYKYMAPEVFNNRPYGSKADQYSLGLVLYWLLNERRTPFLPPPPAVPGAAEEDRAKARRFAGEPIPAPLHGSEGLKRIVLKALACDPDGRYPDAAGMLRALEALERGAVPPQPSAVPRENADATVGVFHTDPSPRSETPARADADATVGVFRPEAPKLSSASAQPVSSPAPRAKSAQTFVPPSSEEATPTKKNKRGLVFGLCGALALGLILLLILLPGKKGSPSAAPAGTEPPVVMETLNPEVTPEPTSESTPETTPEPTPEPIAEPPEELLAQGYTQLNDGVYWKLEDGVLTIAGQGDMAGYENAADAPWYADRNLIEKIVIEEGITSTGKRDFAYCRILQSVELPQSLRCVGDASFSFCSTLPSIELPAGLTRIEHCAWAGCTNLRAITIPANVDEMGVNPFYNCKSLEEIVLSPDNQALAMVDGVLFTKDMRCLICYPQTRPGSEYHIPEGVEEVWNYAFFACRQLTAVELPDSLTKIGAFSFASCSSLVVAKLPDGVTFLGARAFYSCSSITELELPAGLKHIGEGAFTQCRNLTAVTIPAAVDSIESNPFSECAMLSGIDADPANGSFASLDGVLYTKDLQRLICYPVGKAGQEYVIPSGVTEIGSYAFFGCKQLTDVSFPEGLVSIKDNAFNQCSSLQSPDFPSSLKDIGKSAFVSCFRLSSLRFPSGLNTIGAHAFINCREAEIEALPEGLCSLGDGAFFGCSILLSGKIPSSLTSIGDSALSAYSRPAFEVPSNNPAFTSSNGVLFSKDMNTLLSFPTDRQNTFYVVPEGVAAIGGCAFRHSGLSGLELPESLISIGDDAFQNNSFPMLRIPGHVSAIGNAAFYNCSSMTEIAVDENNQWYRSVDGVLFSRDMRSLICYPAFRPDYSYKIPVGVAEIRPYAFYFCRGLAELVIPEGVRSIGAYAFFCSDISVLKLPASLTAIDSYAFYDCSSLIDVAFAGSEEQWKAISIGSYNDELSSAGISFNAS